MYINCYSILIQLYKLFLTYQIHFSTKYWIENVWKNTLNN